MARDNNQVRYMLKQGNVISINLTHLSLKTEHNLLGFDKDRSVFEYADEKLKKDQQEQQENDCIKQAVGDSQGITTKPIIIKSIGSTGGLILINDKNIKIPVKKCTNVPHCILKMIGDKKEKQQTTSLPCSNLPKRTENLALTKSIRTYEKKRDKAYQYANADNQNAKVNKPNACSSIITIKNTHDDCGPTNCVSDKFVPNPVGVVKINEGKFVDQIKHRISLENINKLLNGATKKNVIVFKYPSERRNTIDNGELQTVKPDHIKRELKITDVPTSIKPSVIGDSYIVKNAITPCDTKDLNCAADTIIDLTDSVEETIIKEELDEAVGYEEPSSDTTINAAENETCIGDTPLRFKNKQVIVNLQEEIKQEDAGMGKIKHFKERTDSMLVSTAPIQRGCIEKTPAEVGNPRLDGNSPVRLERGNDSFGNDLNVVDASLIQKLLGNCKEVVVADRPVRNTQDFNSENSMRDFDVLGEKIKDLMTQQRLKNKRKRAKNLFLRREMIEKCVKAISQKRKKPKNTRIVTTTSATSQNPTRTSSCQTETLPLATASTQTDSNDVPAINEVLQHNLNDLDDYRSIIGNDVSFGDGPRMPPNAGGGANVTCNLGSTLDSFVGNQDVAPTQLVANMGYLGVGNVAIGAVASRAQEKQAFFEYLRTCHVADSAGNLPLHLGVLNNDLEEVKKQTLMLSLWKLSVDFANSNHLTPLHLAVIHNCDETIVNFLIDHGADIGCMDSEGNNAIHLAVFHNSTSLLRILLQRATETSFNLNAFNHEGFSPLLLATIEDKYEMVATFLENGTDANIRDQKSGRTPLFHAVENDNLKMVRLLLDYDANKKIKNFSGTSTHDAVFELESIQPQIKNMIIGKELFTVNSTRTDKRKKPVTEKAKEVCTKKLKTVKTFRKIKI